MYGTTNRAIPMKLLVHIGTAKTGTTTIQHWLHENSDALQSQGVFYSRSLGRPNNIRGAIYALDNDMSDDLLLQNKIRTQHELETFRRSTETDLAQEVETARTKGCSVFVVSNEHMHSRLTSVSMVSRLRSLFESLFSDIRILCFLRPQVDLLLSRLSVVARRQWVTRAYLDLPADDPFVDYGSFYRRWATVFPNRIDLIAFKKVDDVITTLCERLGVAPGLFSKVKSENAAVDYRVAALGYNLGLPAMVGSELNANGFFFQREFPALESISISRSEARDIQSRYEETNKILLADCGQLAPDDLIPDYARYPEQGNLDRIFDEVSFAPFLREMVVRFNVELWLERARTKRAEAERAMACADPAAATRCAGLALRYLRNAEQAALVDRQPDIDALRSRLRAIVAGTDQQHDGV